MGSTTDGSEKMENSILVMPTLKDGVVTLGDLWDCKSSTVLGNLFLGPLSSDHLYAVPVSTLKYTLSHAKDAYDYESNLFVSVELGLECAGGSVKIRGKASFDHQDRKKYDEESLFCDYDLTTFQVTLKEAALKTGNQEAEDVVSPRLLQLINEGKLSATHYVESVVLGGKGHASITYFQNLDKSHMNLTGSLEGTIAVGPVTASAKASVEYLDSKFEETHSTQLTVTGQPGLQATPTSCKKMFEEIEQMDKAVEAERHFPQLEWKDDENNKREIYGVPVAFILAPINRIPTSQPPNPIYPKIGKELMESYSKMVLSLDNFSFPDYWKDYVRAEAPTVIPILADKDHPLSDRITKVSEDVVQIAINLKEEALEIFEKVKYGQAGELEMLEMVHKFERELSELEVKERLNELARSGRQEMAAIRSSDVVNLANTAGDPAIEFFTNALSLRLWYETDIGIQVLLLPLLTDSEKNSRVFHTLYSMAGEIEKMDGVTIGVAFPSVSLEIEPNLKDTTLLIKVPPTFQQFGFKGESDTGVCLHLLKMALGVDAPEMFQNYITLKAEMEGVPLQLKRSSDFGIFTEIYMHDEENVIVTETLCDLLARLELSPDSTVSVVFPIEEKTAGVDYLKMFFQYRALVEALHDGRIMWYFSRLGVAQSSQAAPVCFLFKGDSLKGICFDSLDVAIFCEQTSSEGVGIPEVLSVFNAREGNIYIDEFNYAGQFLPNCLLEHGRTLLELLPNITEFPNSSKESKIREAIDLVSAMASKRGGNVFTALCQMGVKGSFGGELEQVLEIRAGWGKEELTRVEDVELGRLIEDIQNIMYAATPYLMQISLVISDLNELTVTGEEPFPVMPIVPTPDPDNPIYPPKPVSGEDNELNNAKMDEIIKFIMESPSTSPFYELVPRLLPNYKPEDPENVSWMERKDTIVSILNVFLQEGLREHEKDGFYLTAIVTFAESFMKATEGEISMTEAFVTTGRKFIERLIKDDQEVEETELAFQTKRRFEEGLFYKCLHDLSRLMKHPKLRRIQELFREAPMSLKQPDYVKRILEEMKSFTIQSIAVIWAYPKFLYLLRKNVDNRGVLHSCMELLYPHSTKETPFPFFVPQDVSTLLQPLLSTEIWSGPPFDWKKSWSTFEDFIEQLRIFVAKGRIPDDFQEVLLHHVLKDSEFNQKLKEKECLFHFDEERGTFLYTWLISNVKEILSHFMEEVVQVGLTNKTPDKVDNEGTPKSFNTRKQILPLKDEWIPFTENGNVEIPTFASSQILRRTFQAPPRLGFNEVSRTCKEVINRLINPLNSDFKAKTQNSAVVSMVNYPNPAGLPFQINFNKDATLENFLHAIHQHVLDRGDALTLLMQSEDAVLIHYILQHLADAQGTLPLVVRDIRKDSKYQAKFLLSLVEELIFKHTLNNRRINFTLSNISSRFILCLRIGKPTFPLLGRSSYINKLLLNDTETFGSLWSPQNESAFGSPLAREGMLEFIQIKENSLVEHFQTDLSKRGIKDPMFLAILHGDARIWDDSEYRQLTTTATALLVFYHAENLKELKRLDKALQTRLGTLGRKKQYSVVLYPDSTIANKVDQDSLIYQEEPESIKGVKLYQVLAKALEFHSEKGVEETDGTEAYLPGPSSWERIKGLGSVDANDFIILLRNNQLQDVRNGIIDFMESGVLSNLTRELGESLRKFFLKPKERMLETIHFIHLQVEHICEEECDQFTQKIKNLRNNCDTSFENEMKHLLDLREERKINIPLLFNFAIYYILKEKPNELPTLRNALKEALLSGFPIHINQSFENADILSFFQSVLSSPELGSPKILTVSICGGKGSGKSSLLNEIFGGKFFSQWTSTSGTLARLVPLEKEDFPFGVEADYFLVLDNEGYSAPENSVDKLAQENEVRSLTFLLERSDLVLVFCNKGEEECGRVLKVLEGSLLTLLRKEFKPDPNRLLKSLPNISIIGGEFTNESIQLGVKALAELCFEWKMEHSGTELAAIVADVFSSSAIDAELVHLDWRKQILLFKKKIEQKVLSTLNSHKILHGFQTWFEDSKTLWLASQIEKKLMNVDQSKTLLKQEFDVEQIKLQMYKAFSSHQEFLIPSFSERIGGIFSVEKEPVDEAAVEVLMSEIRSNLSSAIDDCKICAECDKAFAAKESLYKRISITPKFQFIKENLSAHSQLLRFQTYQVFYKLLLAKRMRARKSVEWKKAIDAYIEEGFAEAEVYTKFLQRLSALQYFPNWVELFQQEVEWTGNNQTHFNGDSLVKTFMDQFYSESAARLEYKELPFGFMKKIDTKTEFWLKNALQEIPLEVFKEAGNGGYKVGFGKSVLEKLDRVEFFLAERLNLHVNDVHSSLKSWVKAVGIEYCKKWFEKEQAKYKEEVDICFLLEKDKETFLEDPSAYFM